MTYGKARAVTETFRYLTDAGAAAAEAMIAGQLAGRTYPQVLRLAGQASRPLAGPPPPPRKT